MAVIKEIENTPGVLWKANPHPRFASEAPGASKSLCGVNGDTKAIIKDLVQRGEIVKATEEDAPAVDIPESFDSATNWPNCAEVIGDIRDQSNCGCCWAFAAAEAASDRLCIATDGKAKLPLSAESLCFCASDDGCDGGDILTPWQFIKDEGLVTGGQFQGTGPFGAGFCSPFSLPHCHHHGPQGSDPYPAEGQPGCPSESSPSCPKTCDSSASGDHTNYESDKYTFSGRVVTYDGEEQIQRAIMSGGPVDAAFTVYSDFENYAGGIYHHVTGELAGGHAIKIVGWGVEDGTKYWKVANSWNPYWGEKGYFRIKRGTDECGIESQTSSASSSAQWKGAGL